jgi:hypothetical protein
MAVTPSQRCAGGGGLVTPLPPQTLPLATTSPFTPRGRARIADTPAWLKAWTQAAQLQQAPSEQIEGAMESSRSSLPDPLLAVPDGQRAIATFPSTWSASACIASMSRESTSSASTANASTLRASTSGAAPSLACPQGAAPKLASPAGALAQAALSMPIVPGRSTEPPAGEPADPPNTRGAARRTEPPEATPRAPVRVHVDRQEDGCVVWLGVDGGAEHLARQIVDQLAPSRPGAVPVLAVVCNGIPVYTRPRIPKENP